MKQNNIKIAIVEDGNFYNNLVDNQIYDLSTKMQYSKLNWIIKSFENTDSILKDSKTCFSAMIFDNYSKANNVKRYLNTRDIIDQVRQKNKDCLFISVTGTREIMITAEYYKEGELCFYYLKESNFDHQNFEKNLITPVLYKLMDKLLDCAYQKILDAATPSKKGAANLRISA